jgi:hypothetical protein
MAKSAPRIMRDAMELSAAAGTSRTRLTALLSYNTARVSTDLMLRILLALGYRAKITFRRQQRAA